MKDLVKDIKINSSKWLKTKGEDFSDFHWQSGYGGFSVGEAQRIKTIDYIKKQELHHTKMTFKDEFLLFLKKNKVDYNEKYIWD